MRYICLGLLLFVLAACSSTSVDHSTYKATSQVSKWQVDFTYGGGSGYVEAENSAEKGKTTKIVSSTGRDPLELKLRDDLVFWLKDHQIDVERDGRDGDGKIHILALRNNAGGFWSIDVEIALPNGEVAKRIKIRNIDGHYDDMLERLENEVSKAIAKEGKESGSGKLSFSRWFK